MALTNSSLSEENSLSLSMFYNVDLCQKLLIGPVVIEVGGAGPASLLCFSQGVCVDLVSTYLINATKVITMVDARTADILKA